MALGEPKCGLCGSTLLQGMFHHCSKPVTEECSGCLHHKEVAEALREALLDAKSALSHAYSFIEEMAKGHRAEDVRSHLRAAGEKASVALDADVGAEEEGPRMKCAVCGWDMQEELDDGWQTASRSLHPKKDDPSKRVCSHCVGAL